MPFIKVWVPGDSDDLPPGYHESPPVHVPPASERTFRVRTGLVADKPNLNNRIYPRAVLEAMVQQVNDRIAAGKDVYGELDKANEAVVSLNSVSHKIIGAHIDDTDELVMDIEVVPSPCGNIALAMLKDDGMRPRMRLASRGVGSIDKRGEVQPDFRLITFDLTHDEYEEKPHEPA